MPEPERSVLHVLPHPGGGGETYVDTLSGMKGYRFERVYLGPNPRASEAWRAVLKSAGRLALVAHRHDLMHVHGEVGAGACLPALATRPSVVTLHGLHLLRRAEGATAIAARMNLRLAVRAATRTICVSEAEYADATAVVGPVAASRLSVIHNGVPPQPQIDAPERKAARAEFGIAEGTIVAAYVGALVDHKDPITAARAAMDVAGTGQDFVLLVAGDGPLRPEVDRIASESAGAVRTVGFRPNTRAILAAADLLVLPSRREGLSYALLESMSLGLPAVVSNAPGNPEAVGEAGIVVACGDISGFASALRQLAVNRPARIALGERARERVREEFRAAEMQRRTRQIYDETVAGRGKTTLRRRRGGASDSR